MKKGFTLNEVLAVVLIIGILAAAALPQYQKSVERARATEAATNLRALVNAENLYIMTNGVPTEDLTLLDVQLNGEMKEEGRTELTHFTYDIRNLNTVHEVPFEAVAVRNRAGKSEGLLSYYLYYNWNGNYMCVAQEEKAKSVCSALCGGSVFGMTDRYPACLVR